MNLGVFKFVNIRFVNADSAGIPRLEPHIYLTPLPLKNLRFELQGVSQSNNLAGPVFNSSFRNKNLFGGAELFTLSFEAGLELPVGGGASGGNSYEIGTRGELELPKFVIPFRLDNVSSLFVPKTHIVLGFNLLNRLQYYQLFSVDASFGYNWKESISKEHNFNLLSITLAHLTNTTQKFNDLLNANPLLKKVLRNSLSSDRIIPSHTTTSLRRIIRTTCTSKEAQIFLGTCCSLGNHCSSSIKRRHLLRMHCSGRHIRSTTNLI